MATWLGARTLVTGASGFIGSHLVERLCALGAEVHATSRRPQPEQSDMEWHVVDLTEQAAVAELVEQVRPEVVFHLAGRVTGARDPSLVLPVMRVNLGGVVNLLSALTGSAARVVLAGSLEETLDGGAAYSPYIAAKRAAAEYAQMYYRLWDLPVTVLRIAMAYGPAQPDESKLVPYTIKSLLHGESPRLSTGTRLLDWVYVDDVVDAFLAAAGSSQSSGALVDIGSGRQVSVRETVERICSIVGGPVAPRFGDLPDRPYDHDRTCDLGPAERLLGWRPSVDLDEGLSRTVSWYTSRLASAG